MTVKDILACAGRISKRKLTAPQYVENAFQTALINRRRMTAWYRANKLGDENDTSQTARHEHFTQTLSSAYTTLFPEGKVSKSASVDGLEAEQTISNGFGLLEDAPTEPPSKLSDAEIKSHLDEWANSNLENRSATKDDPFDEIYDLYIYVLEMDYMATVLKKYWSMAAEGTMPIALAAWLTTAGYTAICNICEVYQNAGGIGHQFLLQQYMQKKARMQIKTGQDMSIVEAERSGHVPLYKQFSSGMGLMTPIYALQEFAGKVVSGGKMEDHYLLNIPKEKPRDFIISPRREQAELLAMQRKVCMTISDPTKLDLPEHEATAVLAMHKQQQDRDNKSLAAMTRGIMQVFTFACAEQDCEDGKPNLDDISVANPLLVDTMKFMESGKAIPRTELVFGLQLLLETGKSFFWKDEKPNPVNIRLKALQLANEVKQTALRIIKNEAEAGMYRNVQVKYFDALQAFHNKLEIFTGTARFDLYYQMPWTAGMQLSETLYGALEFGVALCRTRGIFGQMLHVYNVARHFDKTPSSPLLEQLCDLFIDQIFLGERPKKNFQNILLRSMGGDLQSRAKTSKNGRKDWEGKFHIGAPKSLMDGAEDNKRLQAYEWSFFDELRGASPAFYGNGEFYAKLFTDRRAKKVTEKQRMNMEQKMHDMLYALTLERIKDAAMPEFTGPFPVAKINYFKLYELACEVLTEIAARYQQKLPVELKIYEAENLIQPAPADACAGSSYVTVLMQDVDIRMGHGRTGEKAALQAHSGLKLVGNAFNKCLSGKTVEHFLWKNV
ncbi:hypothetical protein LTR56_017543 [Elasticomyces elasticus]|nr:hypothetical protein LTR22_022403 [Elasticomyces elasticus]KAK3630255.1 hypothetical protein LTR56_017543 [Elasticomyces elasticus]KAK4913907.1 hypothetical protein LTR49_017833 [Elasticomyces elasticus]KAK5766368.1 hypothetical protein LTS12_003580 [Elasticomyces elasticus]